MAAGKNVHSKWPFELVESTWSPELAPQWAFRSYQGETLAGMIGALFDAAQASEVSSGVAYIPRPLRQKLREEPIQLCENSGLLTYGAGKKGPGWQCIDQPFSGRTALGRDLWIFWVGQSGTALLTARRSHPNRSRSVLPLDTWDVRMSWHPSSVREAARMLSELWQPYMELRGVWPAMEQALERFRPSHKEVPNAVLHSALGLADHIDPWTRQHQMENAWITLINKVQDKVAWELNIDKLMPAIGEVMQHTLTYDLFEILVFTSPGKMHEEFLAWRNNRTGIGGKGLSLLIDRKLVETMIEQGKPRLIGTTAKAGVLNPHLASLARLREGLVVPLIHEKRAEGLMSLYYTHETGLHERELARIERVGNVLARSIANTNAHQRVQKLATTDGLTGLANRRTFNDAMKREMRRAKRYKQLFGLIMIDIDRFKNYNDSNGHLLGDRLLRQFSDVLTDTVRTQDIVARYGGEEFAVILPHTSVEEGLVVAEKVRSRVEATEFEAMDCQPGGRVTVSIGVADSFDEEVDSIEELTRRADLALYHAKGTGRNRSCKYTADLASNKK